MLNILIVGSDPQMTGLLKLWVESKHLDLPYRQSTQTAVSHSADDAVNKIQTQARDLEDPFHLVICDFDLHHGEEGALITRMAKECSQDTQVLILSERLYDDAQRRHIMNICCADEYQLKPAEMGKLIGTVGKMLSVACVR